MKKIYLLLTLVLIYATGWSIGFKKNHSASVTTNNSQGSTGLTLPANFHPQPSNPIGSFQPNTITYFAARHQFANFSIEASDAGLPVMITATLKNPQPDLNDQIFQYLNALKDVMHISDPVKEFAIDRTTVNETGQTLIRMKQLYQGLTVYNSAIILHLDNNGNISMMNGRYFRTPANVSTTGTVSNQNAIEVLTHDMGSYTPFVPTGNLAKMLKPVNESHLEIFHRDFNAAPKLCWHITYQPDVLHTWEYFIDANSGALLNKYDRACTMAPMPATNGSGTDLNGINQSFSCYTDNTSFFLLDISRAMFNAATSTLPNDPKGGILVADWGNQPSSSQTGATQITSGTSNFNNPTAVSAYFNASTAYGYYLNIHGRNAIDGQGGSILSFINVSADANGTGLDNAFWNGQAMFYGNGDQLFIKPLAAGLDVGGHEMTHGVIQSTANLTYQDQSGAMNESFADVFGCNIYGHTYNYTWTIGAGITSTNFNASGVLRSMADPHNGGTSPADNGWQPANFNEYVTGTDDHGGVHINSGITNKAYYLFATDPAVGTANAENVYYHTLTTYLVAGSQFTDLRVAVLKSLQDLFPNNTAMQTAACNAFDAVGITGDCNGNTTPDNHQDNLPNNPGQGYILYVNWADSAREYIANENGTSLGRLTTTSVFSKPSASDDGTVVVFVGYDGQIHLLDINYTTSSDTDVIISDSAIWRNVVISKDGNKLAALKADSNDTHIYVYDVGSATVTSKAFQLYNPNTASDSIQSGGVKYADAMEWDYTGQWVMFDEKNELKVNGVTSDQWDIGFMHVWDGSGFSDGTIQKLFSNLPDTVNVGNPVFAKNSPYVISFDYISNTGTNYHYGTDGANVQSGDVGGIIGNDQLGFPCYSKNDDKLIFDTDDIDTVPWIGFTHLDTSKITYSGGDTLLIDSAYYGIWIAAGTRQLPSGIQQFGNASTGIKIYPNPFSGIVTISPAQESDNATIIVSDLQGREVFMQANKPVKAGTTIDLSHLNQGIYILQYRSGNSFETVKVVKM